MGGFLQKLMSSWTSLIVSSVVAITYTIASIYLAKDSNLFLQGAIGLILTLLTGIGSTLLQEKQNISKMREEYLESIQLLKTSTQLIESFSFLLNPSQIIRDTGSVCIAEALAKIKSTRHGIEFIGNKLSVSAYESFWCNLVAIQSTRSRNRESPLHARMTHSSSLECWMKPDSLLYEYQKAFVTAGGVAQRVLIGKENDPDDKYTFVMNLMRKNGIDVTYLNANEVPLKDDFLWVEELDCTVKWSVSVSGNTLSKCTLLNHTESEIKKGWHELERKLWPELENKSRVKNPRRKSR